MANYLYNGVKLPALPEWDKTAYPYAAILIFYGDYWLICAKQAAKTSVNRSRLTHPNFEYGSNSVELDFLESNSITTGQDSWGALTEDSAGIVAGDVLWTNFDMKDDNGDLRVARTTPIPVPGLDPKTFIAGWLVGRAIASQRNNQPQEPSDVPDGVLISSDGYILRDCNGVYLIAKEDA